MQDVAIRNFLKETENVQVLRSGDVPDKGWPSKDAEERMLPGYM